jgi:hypothetical protein
MKQKCRFLPILIFTGYLTCVAFLSNSIAFGQRTIVSGQVKSQIDSAGLMDVHVVLTSYISPTIVRYATSQREGRFTFVNVQEGLYRLTLSHISYQTLFIDSIACHGKQVDLGWLHLTWSQQTLEQVTIRAKKPVIHYESDRFRVDVKAMNTRGDQAVDLLGRIPGVKLDRDGELSLQGKSGVLVYINGKQSYLTGSALLSYLKSLPAGDIASIDFLPTPPASYDAAGSGGVIDIHLGKHSEDGFSVNSTLSVTPLARTRSGLTTMLTGRWGKWQGYGQLALDHSPTYETEKNDRQAASSRFHQESNQLTQPTDLNGMLGISYQFKTNQVVGLDGKAVHGWSNLQTSGQLAQIGAATPLLVDLQRNNRAQVQRQAFHMFYNWTIDTLGSALSIDADYYRNEMSQWDKFSNIYIQSPVGSLNFNSRQDQMRFSDIYAIKADWTKKIRFAVLEAGLKSSYITNTSRIDQDSLLGSDQHPEPGYSNVFTYLEQIQAAYITIRKSSKYVDVNIGLRYEHTKGADQVRQFVDRRYGYLFPSASLISRLGAHQLNFSYRRSIIRPVYTNLNPFSYYSDAFNAVTGNPGLNPALAHIGGFNYIFKDIRLLTVNFIEIQNATLDVLAYDPLRQVVNLSRPESLGLVQTWYIATGQALKLAKGWSVGTDIAALYNRIVSPSDLGQWSMTAQISSDWQLNKGWSASFLAKYASPTLYELSRVSSVGTVSVGLKKVISQGKGFIAFDGNDLFYSDRYKASYRYGPVQQQSLKKWQSRTARITLNYTFGRSKVALNSRRETSPEEIDRLKQD